MFSVFLALEKFPPNFQNCLLNLQSSVNEFPLQNVCGPICYGIKMKNVNKYFVMLRTFSILRIFFIVLILIVFRFIRDWVAGAAASVETHQTSLYPDTSSSSSVGSPRRSQARQGRHSSFSMSCVIPWATSWWDVPGTPPEEGVQEAHGIDARATSTGSSRFGRAAALLRAPPGWPSSSPYL
ncbi:hypothetical protein GOODEAATRI_003166 [Goodea atripinnis]|uniref:Uncharacterized protein n=1 Tax=Goodea atripinnis TaxID=208336 RepID=A0ABV0NRC5_9TELE